MAIPLVLDLLRHGQALPPGTAGDGGRPLSDPGRRALEELGEQLEREGTRHDRVLASPLKRAAESAAAVLKAFQPHAAVETLGELAPDATAGGLLRALQRLGLTGGHALLVGHQPLLAQLTLVLTGIEIMFAPGSLVRIQCPSGLVADTCNILLTLHPA